MKLWLKFSVGTPSRGGSWLRLGRELLEALRNQRIDHLPVRSMPERHRTELVWRHASRIEEHESEWIPHRIVRWTPRSILVEAHPWLPDTNPAPKVRSGRLRAYWLNRWDFEHSGVARVRAQNIVFFKTPRVSSEIVDGIESLLRLGLWFPCTENDLRRAFLRRAQESHPDVGGSEEQFLRLQNDRNSAATLLTRLNQRATESPDRVRK